MHLLSGSRQLRTVDPAAGMPGQHLPHLLHRQGADPELGVEHHPRGGLAGDHDLQLARTRVGHRRGRIGTEVDHPEHEPERRVPADHHAGSFSPGHLSQGAGQPPPA